MADPVEPGAGGPPKQKVEKHPSFVRACALRDDNLGAARLFLASLLVILIVVVLGSAALHLITPPPVAKEWHVPPKLAAFLDMLQLDTNSPVTLDNAGHILSLSEIDLRWYVGRDQSATLIAALKDRARRITELQDQVVRQALLEFEVRFSAGVGLSARGHEQLTTLSTQAATNSFDEAARTFTQIVQGWSDETRKKVGEKAIFELNYGLAELARLKKEQFDSLGDNLRPPRMHQIFWSSPIGALMEAVFWSVIGTLVNLLVNVSQARAQGRFRRDEFWVSLSKLVYGPVLSFVLILAIYFGVLNAGMEVRFWLLPLLGFTFGYNTRKLALLIDRLSEKLLGAVAESARREGDWEAKAAGHAAQAVQAEAIPKSLAEMKQMAPRVVDSAIVAATIKQQNET